MDLEMFFWEFMSIIDYGFFEVVFYTMLFIWDYGIILLREVFPAVFI